MKEIPLHVKTATILAGFIISRGVSGMFRFKQRKTEKILLLFFTTMMGSLQHEVNMYTPALNLE